MPDKHPVDFAMLLASSVHDIKNSLGMLLTSLDDIIETDQDKSQAHRKNYSVLRGEASRINQALICLLGLYRLQHHQLNLNLAEIYIKDFLEEQIAGQQALFSVNDIDITIECEDNLTAFFDEGLIAGVVTNILINCVKYTKNKITLSAKQVDQRFELIIYDNGPGYPSTLINNLNNQHRGIDFASGSTNLGLYFAQEIASIHQCRGLMGNISLHNLPTEGGCFTLTLP